jgi:acyl carrier protein
MPDALPNSADIRQALLTHCGLSPEELTEDSPLFSSGLLDSFYLIELLGRIEEMSGLKVGMGEVSLENFDTPRRIADFLARKRAGGP